MRTEWVAQPDNPLASPATRHLVYSHADILPSCPHYAMTLQPIPWHARRLEISTTSLALLASLFFSFTCNERFWVAINASIRGSVVDHAWQLAATFALLTALQFIVLSLLLNRWTAKPVLAVLVLLTAAAVYFMHKYGVYLDAPMLRNVLETDAKESRELLSPDIIPYLLFYAFIPLLVLWRLRIRRPPILATWHVRPVAILLAILVAGAALAATSKNLVPLLREHKEIRYLITPSNYIYSLTRVLTHNRKIAARPLHIVGADAVGAPHGGAQHKPILLVLVVGETVRAANWGLSGYARQTTPELARRDVLNFTDVTSCGTNTETSLPCMFSSTGRRHYDEDLIRSSEGLLQVLKRAGTRVLWRDNQSGCKGVCLGIEAHAAAEQALPGQCHDGRCLDEALLNGLASEVAATPGDMVVVLHMLGNHGPAYFQRYPAAFHQFTPTCDTTELGNCSHEAIVNAYDDALLYTDHVLAQTIDFLQEQATTRDAAMIYLSDHGESLGENGLYLHSLPYAIAPDLQTHVPMVMWFSPGYVDDNALDLACLRLHTAAHGSHDNLFHTVLGLLRIKTSVYEPAMDLTAICLR